MSFPFHLSFDVVALDQSRDFYEQILGCRPGRGEESWCDLDFFGHQLTIHQARVTHGGNEAGRRSLDHFGVILTKERWQSLLSRLEANGAQFRVPPRVENREVGRETGKYVVVDPDGIGLEFKYSEEVP